MTVTSGAQYMKDVLKFDIKAVCIIWYLINDFVLLLFWIVCCISLYQSNNKGI